MDNIIMSASIVPYFIFLYLVWRIYRLDKNLLHVTTIVGFFSMLGFITVTAVVGSIALKVMGAKTLAHVDYLHGLAEGSLTITNGLIAFGLKKQLDKATLDELDEDEETSEPELSGIAANGAYPAKPTLKV